jgi:hypothetical protein
MALEGAADAEDAAAVPRAPDRLGTFGDLLKKTKPRK